MAEVLRHDEVEQDEYEEAAERQKGIHFINSTNMLTTPQSSL